MQSVGSHLLFGDPNERHPAVIVQLANLATVSIVRAFVLAGQLQIFGHFGSQRSGKEF